jgi:type II secretory pathway component PulF
MVSAKLSPQLRGACATPEEFGAAAAGFLPGSLQNRRVAQDNGWPGQVRIPAAQLILFTRQLVALLQNGVSIVAALQTLGERPDSAEFGRVLDSITQKIASGVRLSHALQGFPRVFPTIYVTMVRIGEETGKLDESMVKLAGWLEGDEAVRNKVKHALSYPLFILGLATLLTLALFYGVMPTFVEIFAGMNIPLPWITRLLLWITNVIRVPAAWLLLISLVYGGWRLYQHLMTRPEFRIAAYRALLQVPMLGRILLLSGTARYAAALAATLSAGLPLTNALGLAAHASDSPLLRHDAPKAVDSIKQGILLTEHMMQSDIYPPTLVQMVASGEEASRIPEMLENAASYCVMELESRIDALSAALEPIMLVSVAFVVGGVMLAIFLPLYSYLGQLGA